MRGGAFLLTALAATAVLLRCQSYGSGDEPPRAIDDGGGTIDAADAPSVPDDSGPPQPEGKIAWSTQFPIASSSSAIATDPSGNVIVAMQFKGSNIAFGDKKLSAVGRDLAVVKLSSDGTKVHWASRIGGDRFETAKAITVDAKGDVYVAGDFDGTGIEAAGRTGNGGALGTPSGYIAKIDGASGAGVWVETLVVAPRDGGAGDDAQCVAVRATAAGVAFACSFRGLLTYSGVPGSENVPDRLASLIGTLDPPTGAIARSQVLMSNTAPAGAFDQIVVASGVQLDAAGNVYVAGISSADMIQTRVLPIPQAVRKGATSAFIVKLSPNLGGAIWVRVLGSSSNATALAAARQVRIDERRGAMYVAGTFGLAIDLGFGEVASSNPDGSADLFVVKLDTSGTPLWQKTFGAKTTDAIAGLDVDPWGRPVLGGSFNSTESVVIDGRALPTGNVFHVLKLDPSSGTALYVTARGSAGTTVLHGVTASPNGHAIATGYFMQTLELETPKTSSSLGDQFVVDLTP